MHKCVLSLPASPRLCQGSLLKSEKVGEAVLIITKSQGRNRILLSLSLNPSQLPRDTCTHSAILRFLVAERPENQGWIHMHQQMRSRCSGAESPPRQLTQHPRLLLLPLPLKNHQLSPLSPFETGKTSSYQIGRVESPSFNTFPGKPGPRWVVMPGARWIANWKLSNIQWGLS